MIGEIITHAHAAHKQTLMILTTLAEAKKEDHGGT